MDTSLTKLFEEYKNEYLLYEGLILSHSIQSVLSVLHRMGMTVNKKDNKVIANWKNVDNISMNRLNTLFQNLGWYPIKMSFELNGQSFKTVPYDQNTFNKWILHQNAMLGIELEPKYDTNVEKYPTLLYHITEYRYWPKIQQVGLIPKNKNKLTPHPERVYLSFKKSDAMGLFPILAKQSSEFEFALLEIDTNSIPQYFKIYNDPNFNHRGGYTLNTIPPYSIELIDVLKK